MCIIISPPYLEFQNVLRTNPINPPLYQHQPTISRELVPILVIATTDRTGIDVNEDGCDIVEVFVQQGDGIVRHGFTRFVEFVIAWSEALSANVSLKNPR